MWIIRDAERLIREMGKQFPVVFVTGARQVGKTSILTYLFPDFAYLTLDDPARAAEAENAPHDLLDSLTYPVIIDEAQYVPDLFRHIKLIVDKTKRKGQFFMTGSQSFSLMQNLSESLAGRCGIINLQPLSAKGFKYLKEYYGKDSLLKGFVVCRVKKDFPIGEGIKAVNGIQFDF